MKRHLKQIEFFYNPQYLETKLFKEPKEAIKKSIAKYRCNLTFKSKAFDFICLPKILRTKELLGEITTYFKLHCSTYFDMLMSSSALFSIFLYNLQS